MSTTSLSLLERLKAAGPESADWHRLKDVYEPLIRSWLLRVPGLRDHVDDLTQEVFLVLVRALPGFERLRHGSFRAWLRLTTTHRVRAFWKANRRRNRAGYDEEGESYITRLEDPNSDLTRQWDRDHDLRLLRKLLDAVKSDFTPATWRAFTRVALDGLSAATAADELAMSETAVVQAKFRVLKRLRQEAGELMG